MGCVKGKRIKICVKAVPREDIKRRPDTVLGNLEALTSLSNSSQKTQMIKQSNEKDHTGRRGEHLSSRTGLCKSQLCVELLRRSTAELAGHSLVSTYGW